MGKKRARAQKPIRVGVVGVRRGISFAAGAPFVGMELAAVCDIWKEGLKNARKRFPGVATYTDFDKFLEHDMDAVVLANYFHEHAPLAVKAMNAGMHVMSETTACKTLGEGVELARTVKKTGKVYMLAENYCYFAYNQEMRRLYRAGEVGEVQFAECEYNHPCDARTLNALSPGLKHWRNWIPSTYYCTHALGPVMFITDTRPVAVNALAVARSPVDTLKDHVRRNDPGSMILCRMDNGAVVHVFGLMLRGHSVWYRIHGTRGLMENLRTGNQSMLRVLHEAWDMKKGDLHERLYQPDFPVHADMAARAGHAGGDFFTTFNFAEAIRKGRQPWLNVHRGLDMSIVGIQAWKSALAGGAPVEVPDLRKESVRKKYEGENWSPYPEDKAPGQPPPSITGLNPPSKRQIAASRKVWKELGYPEA